MTERRPLAGPQLPNDPRIETMFELLDPLAPWQHVSAPADRVIEAARRRMQDQEPEKR